MKNIGGIKIIMITVLGLIILADTGAAASLSNSVEGHGNTITILELYNEE